MRGHSLNSGSITQHLDGAGMAQVVGGDGADARLLAQSVDDPVDCCGCDGLAKVAVAGGDEDVVSVEMPFFVELF